MKNSDDETLARILFLTRYRSRRSAKREIRESGGRGSAEELDALLKVVAESPNRKRIERLADELGAAHNRASLTPRPGERPFAHGLEQDQWIIGEGVESAREYMIYIGHDAAFVGEVFLDADEAPPDMERYELDEGQVLGNVVWLDEPIPADKERESLFKIARERLRVYDAMKDRDYDELKERLLNE